MDVTDIERMLRDYTTELLSDRTDAMPKRIERLVEKYAAGYEDENAKLRLMLKNLVVGIGKELCDYADKQRCSECSMDHKNSYCVVTDAMEILEGDA